MGLDHMVRDSIIILLLIGAVIGGILALLTMALFYFIG